MARLKSKMERDHPYPGGKVHTLKNGLIEGCHIPDCTGREWLREAFEELDGNWFTEKIYTDSDLSQCVRPRGKTSFGSSNLDDYENQQHVAEFGIGLGNPTQED